MNVSFTGTRSQPTLQQHAVLVAVLEELGRDGAGEFHHGGCVGSDRLAAVAADAIGFDVVCHPASDVAGQLTAPIGRVLEPRPALVRNRDIVAAGDVLVALPFGPEIRRSGTWATIREARRAGLPLIVVHPDGRREESGL